jgi:hypothetical protein
MIYGWAYTVKLNCVHGFFYIEETSPGEIARFCTLFEGLEIVPYLDRFTFADLVDAPNYSIAGAPYLTLTATATIADEPGEVMRANGIIYDFSSGLFKPLSSVTMKASIDEGSNYYLSPGLILPGSLTDGGSRVTDYAAWYLFSESQFKYSSIGVTP